MFIKSQNIKLILKLVFRKPWKFELNGLTLNKQIPTHILKMKLFFISSLKYDYTYSFHQKMYKRVKLNHNSSGRTKEIPQSKIELH